MIETFFAIIDIPILQAIGLVFLVALAERAGIPVISFLKSVLKLDQQKTDGAKEVTPSLQPLISELSNRMAQLQRHYNHDTTTILTTIQVDLRSLGTTLSTLKEGIDKLSYDIDKILQDGVRIRR